MALPPLSNQDLKDLPFMVQEWMRQVRLFINSGTIPVVQGGTGLTTVSQGDLLYGSATDLWARLGKDTNATRYLSNTGTSNNPAWAQVDLTNGVTGNLPSSQVAGTSTNDDAGSGILGQYTESVIAQASATSLTTGTPKNITSISLGAGDWDVSGVVAFLPAATTSVTVYIAAINTTSATLPVAAAGGRAQHSSAAQVPGGAQDVLGIPTVRLSLSGTTTVYLVGQANFTVSTMTAYGGIRARRMR